MSKQDRIAKRDLAYLRGTRFWKPNVSPAVRARQSRPQRQPLRSNVDETIYKTSAPRLENYENFHLGYEPDIERLGSASTESDAPSRRDSVQEEMWLQKATAEEHGFGVDDGEKPPPPPPPIRARKLNKSRRKAEAWNFRVKRSKSRPKKHPHYTQIDEKRLNMENDLRMSLHAYEHINAAISKGIKTLRGGFDDEVYPTLLSKLDADKRRILSQMKSMTVRLNEYDRTREERRARVARITRR